MKKNTALMRGNKTTKIIFTLLLLIILSTLIITCKSAETSEEQKRNHPSAKQVNMGLPNFVPGNNDTIIFDYSTVFWSKIATYNLKTGAFKVFDNQIKQMKFPSFSPDGKKIVFLGAHDEHGDNRNIYVMNADGSEIHQITDFDFTGQKKGDLETSNFVKAPSFSPDGKRIIYAKSRLKREKAYPLRGTMDTAWNVYEVEVATGKERRLTNYDFSEMSWPYYMPDGKRFYFPRKGQLIPQAEGRKVSKNMKKCIRRISSSSWMGLIMKSNQHLPMEVIPRGLV